jgi:HAD superfamily hydrolase (TIGR01490 family)
MADIKAKKVKKAKQVVFFDVDGTLLTKNSGPLYTRWLYKQGLINRRDLLSSAYYMLQYKFDWLDAMTVYTKIAARTQGETEAMHKERGLRFFDEVLSKIIRDPLVQVLEKHREKGAVIAILTASTPPLITPLAESLKVKHVLCSRFEVDEQGLYTGALDGEPCFGIGKVNNARRFCEEQSLSFEDAFAYADSMTDRPLLEVVKNPRVVDPDTLLRRLAKRKNWPIWDAKSSSLMS